MRSPPASQELLAQALGGQLQKLRNCFQIPVRVGDIDMAEVCRELREFPANIQAGAISLD